MHTQESQSLLLQPLHLAVALHVHALPVTYLTGGWERDAVHGHGEVYAEQILRQSHCLYHEQNWRIHLPASTDATDCALLRDDSTACGRVSSQVET